MGEIRDSGKTGFLDANRLTVYSRIFIALYLVIGLYWFLPGVLIRPCLSTPSGNR